MKLICTRELMVLRPADDRARELFTTLKFGQFYQVEIKQPRNLQQLRLYFAMLSLIFPMQNYFATEDDLDEEIRIAVGHCYRRTRANGEIAVRAKSLKFSKMDQFNWQQFLDAAIKLVCEKVIPNLEEGDLRREIEMMVGVR